MSNLADPVVDLLEDIVGKWLAESRGAEKPFLVGLMGRGIQSSRSPVMHEREAVRLGLSYAYLLLDFDKLGLPDEALAPMITAAAKLGFRGLNVTHPFKQAVLPFIDTIEQEAQAIGAVNTIVYSGGRTSGHNTDSWGFAESFRECMQGVALSRAVQLGAGGAGAAVAHALLNLGVAELVLIDRDHARAEKLATNLAAAAPGRVRAELELDAAMREADGIVNTTPMGMAKYPGLPLPAELLQHRHWVAEIVYFPVETELLRHAGDLGCRTLAGKGMAIGQAARAFELFTGLKADRAAMAGYFEAAA